MIRIWFIVIMVMILGSFNFCNFCNGPEGPKAHASDNREPDPWQKLIHHYKPPSLQNNIREGPQANDDPWETLRRIYLPFTQEEENQALENRRAGRKISRYMIGALAPYGDLISACAEKFNVPALIIGAVIMVESSGNPQAKAPGSSASGLMQVISATFRQARAGLKAMDIHIPDNPFDPGASIYAGTWYLDRMFERACKNKDTSPQKRQTISGWEKPLEYYYAGPVHGEKKQDLIFLYQNGRQIRVDKKAYSKKVLYWAKILKTGQEKKNE